MTETPAILARGGTSRGLVLLASDLAGINRRDWPAAFAVMLGSPDPGGRQVDGVGGGNATTSKVAVLAPSDRADADVEYAFFQIVVETGAADLVGTCGNMASAAAQVAVERGLVPARDGRTVVRLHDVNTDRGIELELETPGGAVRYDGDFALDGVPTPGSPIVVRFRSPGGATSGRLLPSRSLSEVVDGRRVSLIDCVNPVAFVHADTIEAVDWSPTALERDAATLEMLETVRRWAAARCGFAGSAETAAAEAPYYPFVGVYWDEFMARSTAPPWALRHGPAIGMISGGRPHRAAPLGATIAAAALGALRRESAPDERQEVSHPSGRTVVAIELGDGTVETAAVTLTARPIMRGSLIR